VESEHELTVVDDQAFERGAASVVIVPKEQGPRIRDDIRIFAVWKRGLSGAWKVSHWMWNSTKPVGSGTNRYMTHAAEEENEGVLHRWEVVALIRIDKGPVRSNHLKLFCLPPVQAGS